MIVTTNKFTPLAASPLPLTPSLKPINPIKTTLPAILYPTVAAPQEALSSFLIPLLRPLLKNSPFTCKNSSEFVKKIKDVQLEEDEILVSFDAEALFPSIPIQRCITVINTQLQNDATLSSRTPLLPTSPTSSTYASPLPTSSTTRSITPPKTRVPLAFLSWSLLRKSGWILRLKRP